MDIRFEDHPSFQTRAAYCAAGAAVLGATGSLAAAAAGAAFALLFLRWRGRRIAAACACGAVALAWAAVAPSLRSAGDAALPAAAGAITGVMLGLLFAIDRLDDEREKGTDRQLPWAIALTAIAAAAALAAACALLPPLAEALSSAIPRSVAGAGCGAIAGLWAALCAAPLHLTIGSDPIDARLAEIRFSLGAELRALAERAVAARRSAIGDLPDGVPAELPASIDALAAAALELASRASALTRAASPQAEEELRRRTAALLQSAEAVSDPAAKQSYRRAAEALGAQLEHLQRVRRARERLLARLHEDVANLERTRFSLTLVHGPDFDAELGLLQQRLRERAEAFEEADEVPEGPLRARA